MGQNWTPESVAEVRLLFEIEALEFAAIAEFFGADEDAAEVPIPDVELRLYPEDEDDEPDSGED